MAELETVNKGDSVESSTDTNRTFTTEEVNGIVSSRVNEVQAKYADYDALREKAERADGLEADYTQKLNESNLKVDELTKEIERLKSAAELRDLKHSIATETGVPVNILTGSTAEECKAQAEAVLAFAKPKYPTVKDGGEASNVQTQTTAGMFAEWFNNR